MQLTLTILAGAKSGVHSVRKGYETQSWGFLFTAHCWFLHWLWSLP